MNEQACTTRSRSLARPLLGVLLAILLMTLIVAVGRAESLAPSLEPTVSSSLDPGENARPGEPYRLFVSLAYSGGESPVNSRLLVTLPDAVELAGAPLISEAASQTVDPLQVGVRGETVGWQGRLRPEAVLILEIALAPASCWGGSRTIVHQVSALRPDGELIEKELALTVKCPLATIDQIQVKQRVVRSGTLSWMPYDPSFLPGQEVVLRTTLRNRAPVPVLLGVGRPNLQEGVSVAGVEDVYEIAAEQQRIRYINLAPGEEQSFDDPLSLGARELTSALLEGEVSVQSSLVYCLLTEEQRKCLPTGSAKISAAAVGSCGLGALQTPDIPCPDPENPGSIPDPTDVVTMSVPVRPHDLGDAPDSSNHAGLTMEAYPGVEAHFPTVFARIPGEAAGPLHRHPRLVWLGQRVSMESEADSGPDADPTNNIEPVTGMSDLDRFDDGILINQVNLTHCGFVTMPVRVALRSVAARQALLNKGVTQLYLNVHIDSTADGDWNDIGLCPPGGAGPIAYEHVVIDQPVPVAGLGVGLNPFLLTGNVPALWPQDAGQKSHWLRITLSEQPSPKLPGVIYGDGRGPVGAYAVGESEDHLLLNALAPDLSLEQEGDWTWDWERPDDWFVRYRIIVTNRGNAVASDAELLHTIEEFGGARAELIEVVAPGVAAENIVTNNESIEVGIDRLEVGESRTVIVSWRGRRESGAASVATGRYTAKSSISGPSDGNPINNSRTTTVEERPQPPTILFSTLDNPIWAQSGSTCRSEIQLRGRAQPGSQIRVDGTSNTVQVDDQGNWQASVSGLADGLHILGVQYNETDWDFIQSRTSAVAVRVAAGQIVDPVSFTLSDANGNVFAPDTLSKVWRNLRLPGAGTYEVGINACTAQPNLEMIFYIGETEKRISFTDEDGDGRYTGQLQVGSTRGADAVAAAFSFQLIAESAGVRTTIDAGGETGARGSVLNRADGSPVVGASVALLATDGGPAYLLDSALGQSNPQVTGADGRFYFAPPPGSYQLLVTAPGYQPYRTGVVRIDDEILAPTIRIEASVSQSADVVVTVGAGGFSPSDLRIPPGTVVEWVNEDLSEHTVTAVSGGWSSGRLVAGEKYRRLFGDEGTIEYGDGESSLSAGTIVVDANAPAPGQQLIYLPEVRR